GSTQPTGSTRFLISLSMRAVLNHPGRSNGCSRLLLHRRFQASSSLEACPPASSVTRPNQVHLRYSSHLRLPRLHGIGHPMLMLGRLHVEQAIHMAASFHAARSIRLSWHTKARQAEATAASSLRTRTTARGNAIPIFVAPAEAGVQALAYLRRLSGWISLRMQHEDPSEEKLSQRRRDAEIRGKKKTFLFPISASPRLREYLFTALEPADPLRR